MKYLANKVKFINTDLCLKLIERTEPFELIIPETITSIGDYSFYMSPITKVILNNKITNIGESSFANSDISGELTIPNNINIMEKRCFYNTKITSVISSAKRIEDSCFSYCDLLETFKDTGSLQYLGSNAFTNCNNLQSVELGDNITYIGDYAFSGWVYSQPKITIGKNIEYIGENILYSTRLNYDSTIWINYKGTRAEWRSKRNSFHSNWNSGKTAHVYCTDGLA